MREKPCECVSERDQSRGGGRLCVPIADQCMSEGDQSGGSGHLTWSEGEQSRAGA